MSKAGDSVASNRTPESVSSTRRLLRVNLEAAHLMADRRGRQMQLLGGQQETLQSSCGLERPQGLK
jgi:hypothetical protein